MKLGVLSSLFVAALLMGLTSGPASAAVCTPTGFMRDGINMTAAMINPGDVSGEVDATGCNIGIYYDSSGSGGTVDSANVHGANYFGVAVNGDAGATSVEVTNSSVHDIGETPLNGTQHGVAIYYRACTASGSATGTVSGDTVFNYQKGGIVVSCSGAGVSIGGNTVTGQGPVNYIAQNGIQVGYGAAGQVMKNTVTGNAYSGTNGASSAGILIYGGCGLPITTGIQIVKNTLGSPTPADGNDIGVALFNPDPTCSGPPSLSTNNKVINNTITNEELTNVSGNAPGVGGYQAGIQDIGVNDKLINNKIDGLGYTPNNCGSTTMTSICAIDTSAASKAKVHANAVTP
jgi:hypothetical protein